MLFVIVPFAIVALVGLVCLNVKAGFIVGEATENTGFDAGFYLMTVLGLTAAEASLIIFLVMQAL